MGRSNAAIIIYIIVAAAVAIGAYVAIRHYIFPTKFTPVELSEKEEAVLDSKLKRLGMSDFSIGKTGKGRFGKSNGEFDSEGRLVPERYSEEGASREILITERELNAIIARNTDLADKLAIDLSDGLISAKLLVRLDEDFPFLGGKIVRARAGMEILHVRGKPVVALKGVTVMGAPLPNAWLGGLKGKDLVKEYGGKDGFWKAFADGIENIEVMDGGLRVVLKE
jgi:hypothetical protein